MRFRSSLRIRFVIAMFALVVLICAGFYFAVDQFVEVLEAELMDTAVKRELQEYKDAHTSGQAPHSFEVGKLRGFIVAQEAAPPSDLPAELMSWPSGRYGEIELQGQEFYAGREDTDAAALFMLLDLADIEALEDRLEGVAYGVIVSALVATGLVGYWLSRRVMQPVTQLVGQLTVMTPDKAQARLAEQFPEHEIGLIARAFDRYQARIEQFVQRERAFTDDASHELRTPIAIILSALPLLNEEERLSDQGRQRLARIERAAWQMRILVEALLVMAREEADSATDVCVLDDVLRDVAEVHRQSVQDKGLALRVCIERPVTVQAPPGLVAVVVGNLLGNAVQHTAQGHIELRLEADRLIVEDTGVGMDAEERARIFERRYRGVRSQGLGIGLYLVQRICERLGWRIEVESTANTGTRFILHLNSAPLTKI